MANGHGGRRIRAGRKHGSRDRVPRTVAAAVKREAYEGREAVLRFLADNPRFDPLRVLITIGGDETKPDHVRISAAAAAATLIHPRLSAVSMQHTTAAPDRSAAYDQLRALIERHQANPVIDVTPAGGAEVVPLHRKTD